MNRVIFLLIVIVLSFGCDFKTSSEIVNNTGENLTVTLYFDKKGLDKNTLGKPIDYIKSIKYYNEKLNEKVYFDSNNLSSTFILLPNQKSNILKTVGGVGVTADFSILKELKIETSKFKKNYKVQSFDSIFRKNENDIWQFVVE